MTLAQALALGLGLSRNRADHAILDIDMLDFDIGDLDAPGRGLRWQEKRASAAGRRKSISLPSSRAG